MEREIRWRQSRPEQLVLGKVMKGYRDNQASAMGACTVPDFECGSRMPRFTFLGYEASSIWYTDLDSEAVTMRCVMTSPPDNVVGILRTTSLLQERRRFRSMMVEVPGIADLIPPLAEYPAASVRSSLPPAEWQACLDSWLFSLELRLRLQDESFAGLMTATVVGIPFLVSYCRSHSAAREAVVSSKECQLHRRAYLLFRRLLLATDSVDVWEPKILMDRLLLADQAFHHFSDWQRTLTALRKRQQSRFSWLLRRGRLLRNKTSNRSAPLRK